MTTYDFFDPTRREWKKSFLEYDISGTTIPSEETPEKYQFIYIDGKVVLKTELVEYAKILSEKNREASKAAKELMRSMLLAAPFPAKWVQEEIEKPSKECIDQALSKADQIYDQFRLIPLRIALSIEEGIILVYWNSSKNRSLKIEIYNTSEVVGLINENKNIVSSSYITTSDNLRVFCQAFLA